MKILPAKTSEWRCVVASASLLGLIAAVPARAGTESIHVRVSGFTLGTNKTIRDGTNQLVLTFDAADSSAPIGANRACRLAYSDPLTVSMAPSPIGYHAVPGKLSVERALNAIEFAAGRDAGVAIV